MHVDAERACGNETVSILNQLRKLDLSTDPFEEVKDLISGLGWYYADLPLRAGTIIIRARTNEDCNSFTHKEELIYVPKERNRTYGRANSPLTTMFYAAAEPGSQEGGRFYPALVTCVCELLQDWMQNEDAKGRRIVTFGYWRILRDLHLCAVVQNRDFGAANESVRIVMDCVTKIFDSLKEKKDEAWTVSTFFADEFAKNVQNNYDYILSAAFAERTVSKRMDGVLYPSVCLDGRGFNIALGPVPADDKIELVAVRESSVYKKGTEFIIRDDAFVELRSSQTSFELVPILNGGKS